MDFDEAPDNELATNYDGTLAYVDQFNPFPVPAMRPAEPGMGTVLGFTKQYAEDGPTYSFVALRAVQSRRGWYLSGPRNAAQPLDWDTLLDFIGGPDEWAQVGVATGWARMVIR